MDDLNTLKGGDTTNHASNIKSLFTKLKRTKKHKYALLQDQSVFSDDLEEGNFEVELTNLRPLDPHNVLDEENGYQYDDCARGLYRALFPSPTLRRCRTWGPDEFNGPGATEMLRPGGFRRAYLTSVENRYQGDAKDLVSELTTTPTDLYVVREAEHRISNWHVLWDFVRASKCRSLPCHSVPPRASGAPRTRRSSAASVKMVEVEGTASVPVIVLSLVKSFVGTGLLFLPRAFYNGGMAFSVIMLALIGWISLYCMELLVEVREGLGGSMSFSDIGGRCFGVPGRRAVDVSLILSQCGFCCAYIIFVAQHVAEVVDSMSAGEIKLSYAWLIWLQVPLLVPLVWIRKVQRLAPTTFLGNFLIMFVIAYITYRAFLQFAAGESPPITAFNDRYFSLFIGTAVYTFEGVGMVIPIHQSMKEKEKFPLVLRWTLVGVCVLFVSFSALNYAAYGGEVKGPVTLNMPHGSTFVSTLQLLYCFALVCTYPLMLYPVVVILESALISPKDSNQQWKKNVFRTGLVTITAVISLVGRDSFDIFIAFIGSFCCIPLAFIYPALFHAYLVPALPRRAVALNWIIVAFGVLMMSYCTYSTIANWIG
eukprot:Rmarinus@m.2733